MIFELYSFEERYLLKHPTKTSAEFHKDCRKASQEYFKIYKRDKHSWYADLDFVLNWLCENCGYKEIKPTNKSCKLFAPDNLLNPKRSRDHRDEPFA